MRTDEVNGVSVLGARWADEKVVWLDVSVNERLVVHAFNAGNLIQPP